MPFPLRAHLIPLILPAAGLAVVPQRALAAQRPFAIAVRPANAHGVPLRGPGYFVLRLAPGQSRRFSVLLSNHGPRALTVDIAPVDATRDIYGNIAYRLQQAPRTQVGAWVHLFVHTIYLRRRENLVVPFLITVPRDQRPGTYIGALTFFPTIHHPQRRGRAVISVQVRLADAIVITVRRPPHHETGT
jgi:hypothetical protein